MNNEEKDSRFQDLYRRYYQSIFSYLMGFGFSRDKARELTQDTFLGVYRSMDQYRGGEWTFLKTTAHNLAANEFRRRDTKKRDREEVPLEELSHPPDSSKDLWTGQAPASPEADLIEQEEAARLRKRLHDAIRELPREIRDCLLLRLGGLKYREIQKMLNIPMDTVKMRLHQAKKRLKELLAEELEALDEPEQDGSEEDHDQEK